MLFLLVFHVLLEGHGVILLLDFWLDFWSRLLAFSGFALRSSLGITLCLFAPVVLATTTTGLFPFATASTTLTVIFAVALACLPVLAILAPTSLASFAFAFSW